MRRYGKTWGSIYNEIEDMDQDWLKKTNIMK